MSVINYIKDITELAPDDDANIKCLLTDLTFSKTKVVDKSRYTGHMSLPCNKAIISFLMMNKE